MRRRNERSEWLVGRCTFHVVVGFRFLAQALQDKSHVIKGEDSAVVTRKITN